MIEAINYQDIFIELDLEPTTHSGNLTCPFCNKESFSTYDNGQAHCHACSWHGNSVKLWAEVKGIDRTTAFKELAELFGHDRIKPRAKSRKEAIDGLSHDLDFLARVRVHFAFYKTHKMGPSHYQRQCGYSQSHFTKVMNGQYDKVSRKAWNEIVLFLRHSIDVEQINRDLEMKSGYWKGRIEDDGQLRESVAKFM